MRLRPDRVDPRTFSGFSTGFDVGLTTTVSLSLRMMHAFQRLVWAGVDFLRPKGETCKSPDAGGGMKLARISPCASRSASHVASFTSLLRPGTFFTCAALARTSANRSSRMCQTASSTHPSLPSPRACSRHAQANRQDPKAHASWSGNGAPPAPPFSCRPAADWPLPPSCARPDPRTDYANVFMPRSLRRGRREALAVQRFLSCSRMCPPIRRIDHPLTTITGAQGLRLNSETGSLAPRKKQPPCRPQHILIPFHPSACATAHRNSDVQTAPAPKTQIKRAARARARSPTKTCSGFCRR